jgi:hypothetical protein
MHEYGFIWVTSLEGTSNQNCTLLSTRYALQVERWEAHRGVEDDKVSDLDRTKELLLNITKSTVRAVEGSI